MSNEKVLLNSVLRLVDESKVLGSNVKHQPISLFYTLLQCYNTAVSTGDSNKIFKMYNKLNELKYNCSQICK